MNRDKVYLKGHVIGHAADTLGYQGLMVQLENLDIVEIDKNLVHKEIGEPQKPVIPQFVANWIKYCKRTGVELQHALDMEDLYFYNYANQKDDLKLKEFFETENNQDLFARAWIDGYEAEKEKRYLVNVKNVRTRQGTLNRSKRSGAFIFSNPEENNLYGTKFTRKELEEAGFGWVFDCPGMEVEEVE